MLCVASVRKGIRGRVVAGRAILDPASDVVAEVSLTEHFDNFASSSFFEEFTLGDNGLRPRTLSDCDVHHSRRRGRVLRLARFFDGLDGF